MGAHARIPGPHWGREALHGQGHLAAGMRQHLACNNAQYRTKRKDALKILVLTA